MIEHNGQGRHGLTLLRATLLTWVVFVVFLVLNSALWLEVHKREFTAITNKLLDEDDLADGKLYMERESELRRKIKSKLDHIESRLDEIARAAGLEHLNRRNHE